MNSNATNRGRKILLVALVLLVIISIGIYFVTSSNKSNLGLETQVYSNEEFSISYPVTLTATPNGSQVVFSAQDSVTSGLIRRIIVKPEAIDQDFSINKLSTRLTTTSSGEKLETVDIYSTKINEKEALIAKARSRNERQVTTQYVYVIDDNKLWKLQFSIKKGEEADSFVRTIFNTFRPSP